MARAFITGVGGQDGSLLAELLLGEGYEVTGVVRSLERRYENLEGLEERLELIALDLGDPAAVADALADRRPDEVYHLASLSHIPRSWDEPLAVVDDVVRSTTTLIDAIRRVTPATRYFGASSAEIFGEAAEVPQTESTPVRPVSPYGCAKAYAHFLVGAYRRRFDLFACSGILYNHESGRRSLDFVTRKVSDAAARISLGLADSVRLGNLDSRRDWGYAGDTVRAMWLMLQADEPDDYVVATGEAHSVRELVEHAFSHVGLDWRQHVVVDDELKRGGYEIPLQVGDPSKIRRRLGWQPTVDFEELVRLMVDADLERLRSTISSP